jgi:hypothetical protein
VLKHAASCLETRETHPDRLLPCEQQDTPSPWSGIDPVPSAWRATVEERAHARRVIRFMVETLLWIVQRAGEQVLLHVEEYLARWPSPAAAAEA